MSADSLQLLTLVTVCDLYYFIGVNREQPQNLPDDHFHSLSLLWFSKPLLESNQSSVRDESNCSRAPNRSLEVYYWQNYTKQIKALVDLGVKMKVFVMTHFQVSSSGFEASLTGSLHARGHSNYSWDAANMKRADVTHTCHNHTSCLQI